MNAMRIVLLVLALAIVGFVAKYVLSGTSGDDGPGKTQPAQQLDNVRDRAKELETQLQRNADRADEGTEKNP